MNNLNHFDFIIRREPIKEVIKILSGTQETARLLDVEELTPLDKLSGDADS
jgi:hypothetical protein